MMETYGLENVKTFDQLLPWLNEQLHWPIDEDNFDLEDVSYEWDAAFDLGLKQEDIAHIREIHQLMPLVTNQPWGIFFINFEDKKIPIGVLKRILGSLTLKKRESANKAAQKGWVQNDLLFISAHGKSGEREMSFLHFNRDPENQNKIILKELGWDKNDTVTKLSYVAGTLKEKLVWPDDHNKADDWRSQWSGAFSSKHGAAISTAKALTKQLGTLATNIRISVNDILTYESKSGPLTKTFENFKDTLFHNLDHDGFADMYAQTICYGLLSARLARSSGGLVADDATLTADVVTHPFLKDLMRTFLALGGSKDSIDFNELGIDEVVDFLASADMEAVKRDFNNKNPDEDPVLHFYEHFLKEYDSLMRQQRGVYYTPQPVVSFIVRSVDEILQKEFGLEDGLADISTWAEVVAKNPSIEIPEIAKPDDPFVQILDPATGTGTFLVETINLIEKRMKDKWQKQGSGKKDIDALWNEYVPKHLLTRLHGFEIMMAPYTIAHIKIGMKLHETGYAPKDTSGPRLRVFLTNTLEEPIGANKQTSLSFITDSLAEEAKGADGIKETQTITVVLGNPPYSNFGQLNKGKFISELIKEYKRDLNETKINLDDDYIKFFRFMQNVIDRSNSGVLGIITNHTHIDGLTHRKMRESLQQTFTKLYNFELNGSIKKRTKELGIKRDQNVFEIQQGVSISIYARNLNQNSQANYFSLAGPKETKFDFLRSNMIGTISWDSCFPKKPKYYFMPFANPNERDWEDCFYSINQIMPNSSSGIKTHLDPTFVGFDSKLVTQNTSNFLKENQSNVPVSKTKRSSKERKANLLATALKSEQTNVVDNIKNYTYRVFDNRKVLYIPKAIEAGDHRWSIMQHLVDGGLAIVTTRQTSKGVFNHIFIGTGLIDMCYLSTATKECGYCFPLFLTPSGTETETRSNFDQAIIARFSSCTGLIYTNLQEDNSKYPGQGDLLTTFGPRDLFDYIYAILHSPKYRSIYADFLKADFPKIPIPTSKSFFKKLVEKGTYLVSLHSLNPSFSKQLSKPETRFIGKCDALIDYKYPKYDNGKVMINNRCHFEDITPDVWDFQIGGYQPLQKWLKDRAEKRGKTPRAGRVLTNDDILHYRQMTIAIRDTITLMAEVDDVINAHGGWPNAFAGAEEATTAPVALPDLAAIPDNAWAMPDGFDQEHLVIAAITDAMRNFDKPTAAERVRDVVNLARNPRITTALLAEGQRNDWTRVVGAETRPTDGSIIDFAVLRTNTNDRAWASAVQTMKGSGRLIEDEDGNWSMGDAFPETSRQEWMQGRIIISAEAIKDMTTENIDNVIITYFGKQQDGVATRLIS